ncbi:MAG: DUF177 domain-containing protein [Deltaproteobacteria bacterium]
MKIALQDIPDTGLVLDVAEEAAKLEAIQKGLSHAEFKFASPVMMHLEILSTGLDVNVSGDIKTELQFSCSRCLKEFRQAFEGSFNVFYTKQAEKAREKELKPSEIEVNELAADELDTTEIAFAQIALEAPIKPMCNEDCRGLCPSCGADLNSGQCRCGAHEKTDPRFAGLKDFKIKNNKKRGA